MLGKHCIFHDTYISGTQWHSYDQANQHIRRAYLHTMTTYNQLNDLRRLVNGH